MEIKIFHVHIRKEHFHQIPPLVIEPAGIPLCWKKCYSKTPDLTQ
jgi:hypothetical protein